MLLDSTLLEENTSPFSTPSKHRILSATSARKDVSDNRISPHNQSNAATNSPFTPGTNDSIFRSSTRLNHMNSPPSRSSPLSSFKKGSTTPVKLSLSIGTVSYTHLDVYKRQVN